MCFHFLKDWDGHFDGYVVWTWWGYFMFGSVIWTCYWNQCIWHSVDQTFCAANFIYCNNRRNVKSFFRRYMTSLLKSVGWHLDCDLGLFVCGRFIRRNKKVMYVTYVAPNIGMSSKLSSHIVVESFRKIRHVLEGFCGFLWYLAHY